MSTEDVPEFWWSRSVATEDGFGLVPRNGLIERHPRDRDRFCVHDAIEWRVVNELPTDAVRLTAAPAPPGQEDPKDDLPAGFVFHGPLDLAARIVTALSQPRPQVRKARKLGRALMDALATDSGATCRHQEARLPAGPYLEQEK